MFFYIFPAVPGWSLTGGNILTQRFDLSLPWFNTPFPPSFIPLGLIPLYSRLHLIYFFLPTYLFPLTLTISLSLFLSLYLYSHTPYSTKVVSHRKGRAIYRPLVIGGKRGRGGRERDRGGGTVTGGASVQYIYRGCALMKSDSISCSSNNASPDDMIMLKRQTLKWPWQLWWKQRRMSGDDIIDKNKCWQCLCKPWIQLDSGSVLCFMGSERCASSGLV